ncbi:hypothetical protein BDP27DRAFT_1404847 [Rhodocollybia butyracea]|uniref:Uncharacterized protein n=1 Tax=Rhodocollybia butyracea TaxID=206335 RepID=A0A9P5U462_9AGAR|nr:hypothetical protein BDP27DRAFT_1404847 [Rhodocollybia butyracea]
MILTCKKILGLVSALALFSLSVHVQPVQTPKNTSKDKKDISKDTELLTLPAPSRALKDFESVVIDVRPVLHGDYPKLPMDVKYEVCIQRIQNDKNIKEGAPESPAWTISESEFKVLMKEEGAQQLYIKNLQLQQAPKLLSKLKATVKNMFKKQGSHVDLIRDKIPQKNVEKTILFPVDAEENVFFVPKVLLEKKEVTGKSRTLHSTSAIPPPPSPDANAPETPAPAGQTMTMSINFNHGVDKTKAQTPEVRKYVTAVQRGEMRWAVEGLHTAIDERRAKGAPFDKIQPGYKPVFKRYYFRPDPYRYPADSLAYSDSGWGWIKAPEGTVPTEAGTSKSQHPESGSQPGPSVRRPARPVSPKPPIPPTPPARH